MTRPQSVGQDRLIEPLAAIHAAPRRIPHRLRYFQEQRIGETRDHESPTASADSHLHCAILFGTLHVSHAGFPLGFGGRPMHGGKIDGASEPAYWEST